MNIKNKNFIILLLIIILSIVLRFYRLGDVPAGFHQDEVSQAYNAYSIGTTGHDRYGQYFPILFRSFGSYQPAVYTYLAPIPILILGNTIFSARFLSALAGVVVVIATYYIVRNLIEEKYKYKVAAFASIVVAISPWAVHFSRRVVEGNVGLAIFLLALLLLIKSLKNIKLFPPALFVLGISTQAYYSERVICLIFIPLFLFVFRNFFLRYKKTVITGLLLFAVTQIPHIWIIASGAYGRRFDQVSYFNNDPGNLPRVLYIAREFIRHYLSYLSPANLFASTGSDLGRVSPELGVFYSWMFLPFLLGIYYLVKKARGVLIKVVLLLVSISLVPASLTGDAFYPLRTLEYLWFISLVTGIGIYVIYKKVKGKSVRILIVAGLTVYSIAMFYISYFILFQHENTEYVSASYILLNGYLDRYKDKNVIIDSTRDLAIGLRIAYLESYNPDKLAEDLKPQLKTPYYSAEVPIDEVYKIGNIQARPISWRDDPCEENTIIVGDTLAISADQAREHGLTEVFEIEAPGKGVVLRGYTTNPPSRCKPSGNTSILR